MTLFGLNAFYHVVILELAVVSTTIEVEEIQTSNECI